MRKFSTSQGIRSQIAAGRGGHLLSGEGRKGGGGLHLPFIPNNIQH